MAPGFVSTAVLETPTGFAFFSVSKDAFDGPESLWSWFIRRSFAINVICLRQFVKVDHKSVVLDDGPGKKLADTIRKCCSDGRRLIVGNEDLRDAIKSKLKIDCFDDKEVIHELMWGLRNVLCDFVFIERCNITREYLLPLSKGLRDCMDKYEINVPTEAVDINFIVLVGLVDRCDTRLKHSAKTIREICDKLVPDIGSFIEDDWLYAEAMAKILTPAFIEEWRPTEWFDADVVKMIDAAEAAAGDAQKKIDFTTYCEIKDCLVKLRLLPEARTEFLNEVKTLAKNISRPTKRIYTEVAEGPSENCSDRLPRVKKVRQLGGGEALV